MFATRLSSLVLMSMLICACDPEGALVGELEEMPEADVPLAGRSPATLAPTLFSATGTDRWVVLNRPVPGTPDPSIHQSEWDMIDAAAPGSIVRIAVSGWDDPAFVDHLKAALDRGVDVRILTEKRTNKWFGVHPNVESHMTQVGFPASALRYWIAGGNTFGLGKITHLKLLLFSEVLPGPVLTTGGSIIGQSSSNWFLGSDKNRPNEMMWLSNEVLYEAYVEFFDQAWDAAISDPAVQGTRFGTNLADGNVRAYLFTGLSNEEFGGNPDPDDPVMDLLDDVECTPESLVWVAASTWSGSSRGHEVLDRLVQLHDEGCDVRIIGERAKKYANNTPETRDFVWETAQAEGIPWAETSTHDKYIVTWAPLKSTEDGVFHSAVMTGSLNVSTPLVDDLLDSTYVVRDDPYVFEAYLKQWSWICQHAAVKTSPTACGMPFLEFGGQAWGSTHQPTAIAFGDVDCDGLDEVGITRKAGSDDKRWWILDDSLHDFVVLASGGQNWGSTYDPTDIAFGDVDGDGCDEIGLTRKANEGPRYWIVDDLVHNAFNESFGANWESGEHATAIAFGNVDADPAEEVAIGRKSGDADQIRYWIRDDHGADFTPIFEGGTDWGTSAYVTSIAFGNIDGDAPLEFGVTRNFDDGPRWGIRDDRLAEFVQVDTGADWDSDQYATSIAFGDVDGDGVDEVAVARRSSANTDRYWVLRDCALPGGCVPVFTGGGEWGIGVYASSVGFGDVDGDGLMELAVGRKAGQNSRLFMRDDAGADFEFMFGLGYEWGSPNYVVDLAFGDTTGDGSDDLGYVRRAGVNHRWAILGFP